MKYWLNENISSFHLYHFELGVAKQTKSPIMLTKEIMELVVPSQEELIALGRWFGEGMTGNEVYALSGPLGSGKTTFVKGLALGLGIEDNIISPTFVLVREYKGRYPLFHFDWYRIETQKEVLELGYYDYLEHIGVKVIEWPEKYSSLIPESARWIKIAIEGSNRKVTW